jgi:[CysO sulfur-carrier protein]-S-L-cysteine hydrolase
MLRLTKETFARMVAHLNEVYPLEGCGILAGRDGRVTRLYPVKNRLQSPVAYEMEPLEQLAAMLDVEERGLELLGIYHSHPNGPDWPSASDVSLAFYPEAAYVIVSMVDPLSPEARAFRIIDGKVAEVELVIG